MHVKEGGGPSSSCKKKERALPACLGLYSNFMDRVPESQTNKEAPFQGPLWRRF